MTKNSGKLDALGPSEVSERRARKRPASKKRDEGPRVAEWGGRGGLEPTRYGDWEVKGIVSDF